MTNSQAMAQLDRTAEDFVVELKAKPTQELSCFLAGSWTASLLSVEEVEELYQELHEREDSSIGGTAEDFVEMGLD
jgi:hypothetical protein